MSHTDRTIDFPSQQSLGRLSVRAAGSREPWVEFAEARGSITVPADKELRLTVAYVDVDSKVFSTLAPDALSVFEWVSTGRATDVAAAVPDLCHLTGLQGLALWETNINDESLFNLRHLSNLRWLDIGDTQVTDAGLRYLCEMSRLYELSLLNDRISDAGLDSLQRLPSLTHMDLMKTPITDKGVGVLKRMRQLRYLRIFGTGITEQGCQELHRSLSDCAIWFYRSNSFAVLPPGLLE